MTREHPAFTEYPFDTAAELWHALSPTHSFRNGVEDFVYRGQADARWGLVPTILRPKRYTPVASMGEGVDTSEMVFFELCALNRFVKHCDAVGIPIPNDSQVLRNNHLSPDAATAYHKEPWRWPDPQILDLMAMAQHHGVPTRLLDWTTRAYTAAYFAASSAVAGFENWQLDDRLAIWALDRVALGAHSDIVLHNSPGAISRHLAAQGGLFTVHPLSRERHAQFNVTSLEGLLRDIEYSPFIKLTLPVYESVQLLNICSRAGFDAATIYPSADGAGKAVGDDMNKNFARAKWNVDEVLVSG
ncbi:FRG domain-containing protein [Pseudomonas guariconensis]|uniref:FRG domain-containing protein n=1 Tax=Pseudomonas guariconensis TaxID=1288410 RepID=UPI0018AA3854|nr:FRG domain-containing protein [Pseudomonas guariconensis]MBF8742157.1 FRG domain-containing protein [Pseudomonas guariconensis]MBF8751295.1 FRG domain-containing protein [Pseudomonas guariconensis]